jgi:hypothetical protein
MGSSGTESSPTSISFIRTSATCTEPGIFQRNCHEGLAPVIDQRSQEGLGEAKAAPGLEPQTLNRQTDITKTECNALGRGLFAAMCPSVHHRNDACAHRQP